MKSLLVISIVLLTFSIHSQNILISENFEDNNLPNGWTISTNASDGGWNMGTAQNIESQWWEIANHGKIIGTNDYYALHQLIYKKSIKWFVFLKSYHTFVSIIKK